MPDTELNPPALRVLIVDRHEVSRAAIRALLRTEGLEVVGDVATAAEGLALADQAKPESRSSTSTPAQHSRSRAEARSRGSRRGWC